MPDRFIPQPEEHPDGSFIFRLRDEVVLNLRAHSETKLQAQMWRKEALLPPDTGSLAAKSFRDKLVKMAKDGFGEKNVPNIEEDVGTVATILAGRGGDGKSLSEKLQEQEGPSLLDRLISFAEEHATFFHTAEAEAHASVTRNGRTETYPLASRGFRLWLKGEFRRAERERLEQAALAERELRAEQMGPLFNHDSPVIVPRPPVLREQLISDALSELEAMAINEGPEQEVHLRVAEKDGKMYLDLVNEAWEVVEVDADGWRVIPAGEAPVRFVRSNTMRPLPSPTRGGSVEDLREILTLDPQDEDDRASWRLILAWLVMALRGGGEQYPILILLGGQGSAKTNSARFLRRLVDPSVVKDTGQPKTEHDLYIRGSASWVISLDNVSSLSHWLSDAICRIATEGGFATRKLYSGREEEVFDALRPFILNGIAEVATRPDILDRSLLVNLPAIKKNRPLKQVRAEFDEKQGGILGALLDAVSAGLAADLEEVSAGLELPRLADFAGWAAATETALGGEPGSFMRAYKQSRGEATNTALEAEPVVTALLKLAKSHSEDRPWEGITQDLLTDLKEKETDEALKRSKEWPQSPRKLAEVLKRLQPALLEIGIHAERASNSNREGKKLHVFYREPGNEPGGDGAETTDPTTDPSESPIDKRTSQSGDGGDDTNPHLDDEELEI